MKNTNGIGFVGLLTILFIGLKLTGYIDWSWFWVLSPILFGFTLGVVVIAIAALWPIKLRGKRND
jgi:membrane glycosyltransferase